MKELLSMSWNTKYECPGGDCGLTCCSGDWKILLSDSEIEKYKRIDNSFKDELLGSIDEKEKCMKSVAGKCALLDENHLCKLVLACGADALSYTCSSFPLLHRDYGIIDEAMVEIVCPIVAEFLFDEEPIELYGGETDGVVTATREEADTYFGLYSSRNTIMNILKKYPHQYIYGKQYILFKFYNTIMNLIDSNQLTMQHINEKLNIYCDENVLLSILSQCEQIGNMFDEKICVMHNTLIDLQCGSALPAIAGLLYNHKVYVAKYIATYLKDKEIFSVSLKKYIGYMQEHFPMFIENFLLYILTLDWTVQNKSEFGTRFLARFIELFVIQIAGMALLEETGKIERKEYAVAISAIDRMFAHDMNMNKQLNDYLIKKQMKDATFLMMLLAK